MKEYVENKLRDVKFEKNSEAILKSITHEWCNAFCQEGKVESAVHRIL